MNRFKFLIFTLVAVLATTSATAYYGNNEGYSYEPYSGNCCEPCDPCRVNCDPCRVNCDPCRVNCEPYCCDLGVEFWAEWLVMRVRKCGLDYSVPFDDDSEHIIGNVHDVTLDWNSGGRWAIFKSCDQFQAGAKYTRFSLDDHKNTTSESGHCAATRLGEDNQFTANGEIPFAYGKYIITYDVVDAEGAYTTESCEDYGARLFGGFRFAHIYQEYRSRYSSDASDRDGTTTNPITGQYISDFDKVLQKNDMYGYGFYLGGSGYKEIACGFGLFGKASVAALVGNFHRKYKHDGHNAGDTSFTLETDLKDDCNRLVNNLELGAGFQYRIEGPCGRDFTIKVGYEFNHWYNTQDFMMLFDGEDVAFDRHIDSLGFDGMTLKLEANF